MQSIEDTKSKVTEVVLEHTITIEVADDKSHEIKKIYSLYSIINQDVMCTNRLKINYDKLSLIISILE